MVYPELSKVVLMWSFLESLYSINTIVRYQVVFSKTSLVCEGTVGIVICMLC